VPTHYAASELLIVLVALWTARTLWRQNMGHGALGTLLFGTAAALGAVKFGLGVRQEGFIALHQVASQFGGLVGVMLFTHQLMTSSDILQKWVPRHRGFAALVALVAFVLPLARVPLFLIWSLGLIVLCATRTPQIALACTGQGGYGRNHAFECAGVAAGRVADTSGQLACFSHCCCRLAAGYPAPY
jgi:hypothetical protein